jgi:hypothetical protein
MNYEIVNPDPGRLIEGLRDTGYNFNTAIADIVDNSIVAEAEMVEITVQLDFDGNVIVNIIDNGYGMNQNELLDAMKYGSKAKKNANSLSKFGLGLKTGSTAFCRRFSVISRDKSMPDFIQATWDLDTVVQESQWRLEIGASSNYEKSLIEKITEDGSGTMVMWEKVDRLIKSYDKPTGKAAQRAISNIVTSLKEHLSMTFQRFLDHTDKRCQNINMVVNGEPIKAWDPFQEKNTATLILGDEDVVVDMEEHSASFKVRSFLLPRKEEFTSEKDFQEAKIRTDNQGIYVYRENRMICGPDWFNIFSKEPHQNLLRVEFSFNNDLDDAFHVDIKKSTISLNQALSDWIGKYLTSQRRAARERYDKGIKEIISNTARGVHDDSNRGIASKEASASGSESTVTDKETGEVTMKNKQGTFTIRTAVRVPTKEGQIVVIPVDSIQDGQLWQPCIITDSGNSHNGVEINTGHPYYEKVYMPNIKSGVTIQGMDSLLWALSEAERSVFNPEIHKQLQTLRYEVSRILRILVEDLPDPNIEQ